MSIWKNKPQNEEVLHTGNSKTQCCAACGNQLSAATSSENSDSCGLCAYCYKGFEEMLRAIGALHYEMATAYGVDPNNMEECTKKLPGISIEEITIRMELNRLKRPSY